MARRGLACGVTVKHHSTHMQHNKRDMPCMCHKNTTHVHHNVTDVHQAGVRGPKNSYRLEIMMEDSSHLYISERRDGEDTQEQLDISWEHLYSHKLPIKDTDKKAFVCQHCNRCFTCQQGLERHMHVHHPCKSPEKISTSMNRQHQEGRVPDNQLHPTMKENANLTQEEIPQALLSDSFQQQTQDIKTISTTVLENNGEQAEQYMLDVSSNISENLSFYIDGKILSTSTINNCEMEIRSGSSTLVGMDTLILGPAQISQVLHTDTEASGQQQSKRRTATPPLLPQIKTELQSEVVMSSSSSLLSSLIENLFPQNTESEIVQEERTVFLSPKLKQLLEKQEGFKPTVALITDGQKSSSPVSLTVLPSGTGKFRRRTGSPTGSSQQILAANEETGEPDLLDLGDGSKRQIDAQCNSPVQQTGNETNDATQSVAVPEGSPVLSESWAPATGGNPCNQQPLDLSNTVKRNEDEASADAALDLSLQRKSPGELGSNSNVAEKVLISSEEQMISHCTIAFASPVTHTVLPAAPSLITVLAPPSSLSNPSNQPIQVLAPNISPEPLVIFEEVSDGSVSMSETAPTTPPAPPPDKTEEEPLNETAVDAEEQTFTKNFICNVCERLFHSMKELGHHVADHADEWPYKCEFCVLLFGKPSALLDHRSSLHGVGKTYVCSACTKEFVYLCNLKQHQNELHPGQQCSYTEEEKGKLRPQNYNNTSKNNTDPSVTKSPEESKKSVKKEECEVDMTADELFTTIKIMTSDGCKIKGPDVRLGINQHYPSFKPPPFPYHNRSPAGSLASATNFTTHNIPQTFSTAIRCTKCGKSFDNMPELHKHILVCANASDKKRYTPRKNPVPLRHFAKTQNGVLSTTNSANGLNTSVRVSQGNRSKPNQEPPVKIKILNKRKKKFVQRIMPHRNKSISSANKLSPAQVEIFVCPHCNREFTMRRSRTKHMAVCPKKPKEMTKRKEGGISLTKENNEHSHRGVSHLKEKLQSPPRHNTRLQTSGSTKRPAILPVQTVFSSKRSKIIIKERIQPKEEAPMLAEVPIRTFNPSLRQYSRVQHSIKGIPIKITIVKPPQSVPLTDESAAAQTEEVASGAIKSCSEQKSSA
uniref:C2H2-type domain-containing protein n=1 Tax=Xiphophorus couchianus TaxID=32473 RepID=A0A3B5L3U6_9TELE